MHITKIFKFIGRTAKWIPLQITTETFFLSMWQEKKPFVQGPRPAILDRKFLPLIQWLIQLEEINNFGYDC